MKIARLARLDLDEQAAAAYAGDLASVLELVQRMQAVDVAGVEPLAHPLEIASPLRADEVTEEDQRERFQQGAPAVADGYYLVPKFMD